MRKIVELRHRSKFRCNMPGLSAIGTHGQLHKHIVIYDVICIPLLSLAAVRDPNNHCNL